MDGDTSVVYRLRTSDVAVLGARFNPYRSQIIQCFFPPVRGDNPRALASGLSPVQVDIP